MAPLRLRSAPLVALPVPLMVSSSLEPTTMLPDSSSEPPAATVVPVADVPSAAPSAKALLMLRMPPLAATAVMPPWVLAAVRNRVPVPVLVSEVAAPLTWPPSVRVLLPLTEMVGVVLARATGLLKVALPEAAL